MRIVRSLASLAGELAAARSEAASAFGDGEVFLEPYVENGRHVEVQILADAHGTVWALGTRDCSLQRRHQKVIEEAPAPGLSPELTETLYALAVRAARATDYRGAGTVEFLVVGDQAHFLEMNTRLQVEHPVTEAVFGVDLVELQLRVAEGAALPAEPPGARGHAVEARLYAEDPGSGWTPQTGVLHALDVPGVVPTHPPLNVRGGTPTPPGALRFARAGTRGSPPPAARRLGARRFARVGTRVAMPSVLRTGRRPPQARRLARAGMRGSPPRAARRFARAGMRGSPPLAARRFARAGMKATTPSARASKTRCTPSPGCASIPGMPVGTPSACTTTP